MKIPLSVLLLAALSELVSGLIRSHIHVKLEKNWFEAQTYCRTHYNDLTSISNEEEYVTFLNTTGNVYDWIGLHKTKTSLHFEWSDGSPITYTRLSGNFVTNYELCGHVNLWTWGTADCFATTGPFFCYTAPALILVKEKKTWEEALEYCRANFTDLASLTSANDLMVANKTVNSTAINVWTGLRFLGSLWFWVNGETVDSQISLPSCPVSPFHCGARNVLVGRWEFRDCREKLSFFCYY